MKRGSGFLGTAFKYVLILTLLGILGAVGWSSWTYYNTSTPGVTFRTEKTVRGNLIATITSTGTIEPEEVVDVGAQVAGRITRFGVDPNDTGRTVDYRTAVKEGTILAELDDKLFQARVEQAKAALRSAEADLRSKEATKAQAEREWIRAERLRSMGGSISDLEYNTARAAYETGMANVGVAEAAIGMAKASLKEAEINLSYTVIKSPVNGVIISRRVNVGQTVVASLSAPSLFLIAKDLKRVQIWVSVNEADIGHIKPGQKATFTVDTFPAEEFEGRVTKIRLDAMMTQNVVTYTVEVTTENEDERLLPYMTANVKFFVDKREGAQLVPNGALRWRPSAQQVHPEHRQAYEQSLRRKFAQATEEGKAAGAPKDKQNRGTVWVEEDDFVRPITVLTGLTDGSMTEIVKVLDDTLDDGTPVILGEMPSGGAASGTVNPFQVKMFGGKKKE